MEGRETRLALASNHWDRGARKEHKIENTDALLRRLVASVSLDLIINSCLSYLPPSINPTQSMGTLHNAGLSSLEKTAYSYDKAADIQVAEMLGSAHYLSRGDMGET